MITFASIFVAILLLNITLWPISEKLSDIAYQLRDINLNLARINGSIRDVEEQP